jgi:hypothetical protein
MCKGLRAGVGFKKNHAFPAKVQNISLTTPSICPGGGLSSRALSTPTINAMALVAGGGGIDAWPGEDSDFNSSGSSPFPPRQ